MLMYFDKNPPQVTSTISREETRVKDVENTRGRLRLYRTENKEFNPATGVAVMSTFCGFETCSRALMLTLDID